MKKSTLILIIMLVSSLIVIKGRGQILTPGHSKCCKQRIAISLFGEKSNAESESVYLGTGVHIRLGYYHKYIKNFWIGDLFMYINDQPIINDISIERILSDGQPGSESDPRNVMITTDRININKFIGIGGSYKYKFFLLGGGLNIAFLKKEVLVHYEERYLGENGNIEEIIIFEQFEESEEEEHKLLVTPYITGGIQLTKYAKIYAGFNLYKDFSPKLYNTFRIGIMSYFLY